MSIENSPLDICFGALSTLQQLTYSQKYQYSTAWDTFRRVEFFNSNVSTQRGQGAVGYLPYYQFITLQEKNFYNQGATLFASYLGFTQTVSPQ